QSGRLIEVELVVTGVSGKITFSKGKQSNTPLFQAPLVEAKSDTLAVTDNDDKIVIDAETPLKNAKEHTVKLKFRAPKVKAATVVQIGGWFSSSSSRNGWLSRGVEVTPGLLVPAKEEAPA